VDRFGAIFRNEGRKIRISKRILIPPFPGSNPGAPAKHQSAELFTEMVLFWCGFLGAFRKIDSAARQSSLLRAGLRAARLARLVMPMAVQSG
jgi:hypothetical protein